MGGEAPATQASAPETTPKEVVAVEAVETQGAPKSTLDATVTKAEEVKTEEAATEEASAAGLPTQASNDETTTPDEVPIATEKMAAVKIAESHAASKAEVTEPAVSVAAADAPVAGKQGGCFSYCTATEAQTEIVVQN